MQTRPSTRNRRRRATRIVLLLFAGVVLWFGVKTWSVIRAPVAPQTSPLVVNDVTQLNPIQVDEVITSITSSYYLPYQLHATEEQFRRAYPRAPEFLALKQRLDPTNKFRSKLLDKYLHPR